MMKVRLYGAFRTADTVELTLDLIQESTVQNLKDRLREKLELLGKPDLALLVGDSALASEASVLEDFEVLHPSAEVHLLPPVCGG